MRTHRINDKELAVRERGFSLIELVVAVAITGVLATIAIPSLLSAIESNRNNNLSNQLMEDLILARSQAIQLGTPVALCGSNSAVARTCVTQGANAVADWSAGWFFYVGNVATVPAANLVIREPQAAPRGWVVMASLGAMNYVSMDPRSQVTGNGHFTIYRSGSATAACVAVSPTGRTRANTASVSPGTVSANNDPC